jgi:hypothetical protein
VASSSSNCMSKKKSKDKRIAAENWMITWDLKEKEK